MFAEAAIRDTAGNMTFYSIYTSEKEQKKIPKCLKDLKLTVTRSNASIKPTLKDFKFDPNSLTLKASEQKSSKLTAKATATNGSINYIIGKFKVTNKKDKNSSYTTTATMSKTASGVFEGSMYFGGSTVANTYYYQPIEFYVISDKDQCAVISNKQLSDKIKGKKLTVTQKGGSGSGVNPKDLPEITSVKFTKSKVKIPNYSSSPVDGGYSVPVDVEITVKPGKSGFQSSNVFLTDNNGRFYSLYISNSDYYKTKTKNVYKTTIYVSQYTPSTKYTVNNASVYDKNNKCRYYEASVKKPYTSGNCYYCPLSSNLKQTKLTINNTYVK